MNGGSDIQLPQSKETCKLIAHSCKNTLCNSNTTSACVCVCVPRLPTYPTKRSRQSGCWSCTCRTNNLWILQSNWDQYKLIAHNCSRAIEPTDEQTDPVRPRRKTSRSGVVTILARSPFSWMASSLSTLSICPTTETERKNVRNASRWSSHGEENRKKERKKNH